MSGEREVTQIIDLMVALKKGLARATDTELAYKMGVDCALNGANEENCHFSIFSTPEKTKAWERGKVDGEKAKES